MSDEMEIPLFPLNTVLFPEGILPLRIFEPRYLDMVSHCMKGGTGFGVCLIREGAEVGAAPTVFPTGTLAKIIDWDRHDDGLLGITACGQQRFHIVSKKIEAQQLIMANVEMISDEPGHEVPSAYQSIVDLLREIIEQPSRPCVRVPKRYADASWVGFRLSELLPLRLSLKQELLELNDPLQRLDQVHAILGQLDFRAG